MTHKILFLSVLISGSLITMSSNSWLPAWVGLEMNLLGFIPLIFSQKNLRNNEAMLKYFLTQAFASSILLMGMLFSLITLNFTSIPPMSENLIVISALMLKLGAAPFHFWFPPVLEGMTWINSLILMTWQKLAPLFLLFYNISFYMMIMVVTSALIGALGGLNQMVTRKILAYSSINHLGWMIMALYLKKSMLLIYFTMYSTLMVIMILTFSNMNSNHMNQMPSFNFYPKISSIFAFNLLSLGGLPPFLGFLPKWLMIQTMLSYSLMITVILVFASLITLFYYMRITYSILLKSFSLNPLMHYPSLFSLVLLSLLSFLGLLVIFPLMI